jgi:catechol 2,3-dioxygenase-like lactoylglutathione lyase family enzyme
MGITHRGRGVVMLGSARVAATLPAQDLERAKSFYADKLGLKPIEESDEELHYKIGEGTMFDVFRSHGKPSGDHTQLGFEVEDLDATVAELRKNGVVFEEYDLPGFKTVEGIAVVEGERGAWFKDSEGNLLAIGEWKIGR